MNTVNGRGSDDGAPQEGGAAPAGRIELPEGRFAGRGEFADRVRAALDSAAREGWREIVLADASFLDWPLGERAVAESLSAWAASGRRCTLLARSFDEVGRTHARFVQWRRTWSHVVDARACPHADPVEFPSAIWSPHWFLRRLDAVRCVGVCGRAPDRRALVKQTLDEWLSKSVAAFPSTTLGL